MIRGATAQFKFQLPYPTSYLTVVKFMAWQYHNDGPSPSRPLPIIKILQQCVTCEQSDALGPNDLLVTLNKEETLRFHDDRKAYVQLLAKVVGAPAFGCEPYEVPVYPVGDEEILHDDITPTPVIEDDVEGSATT